MWGNKKLRLESIKLQSGYEPHAVSSVLIFWKTNKRQIKQLIHFLYYWFTSLQISCTA